MDFTPPNGRTRLKVWGPREGSRYFSLCCSSKCFKIT